MEAVKHQYVDPLTLDTQGGDVPVAIASLFDCDEEQARKIEETLRQDIQMIHGKYFQQQQQQQNQKQDLQWCDRVMPDDHQQMGETIKQHYEMLLSVPRLNEVHTCIH